MMLLVVVLRSVHYVCVWSVGWQVEWLVDFFTRQAPGDKSPGKVRYLVAGSWHRPLTEM